MYFTISHLFQQKDYKYSSAPKKDDYLALRQRGSLEGMAESMYKLNLTPKVKCATGTYDIASKLGLYNPETSFNYAPKRKKPYEENRAYLA